MVAANDSLLSPTISSPDKCSRNKRKFLADTPILDIPGPSLKESPPQDYDPFPSEPFEDFEAHVNSCNACRVITLSLKKALEVEDGREADWSGMTETQLEELLLSNLDTSYKNAIKKVTSYGYKESIATNAILAVGRRACRDNPVVGIAEHALEFLASGKAVDVSERDNASEQFKELEKSLLEDLIDLLKEMQPFFSRGDAMWCLLMCDMNLSHECPNEIYPFCSSKCKDVSGYSASQSISGCNSYNSTSVMSESNVASDKLNPSLFYPQTSLKTEALSLGSISSLPSQLYASDSVHGPLPLKENLVSPFTSLEKNLFSYSSPSPSLQSVKPAGIKKSFSSSSRSRYRSNHLERNSRVHGYRSGSRVTKTRNFTNLLLNKKCQPGTGSINIDPNPFPSKLDKIVELTASDSIATQNFSFTAGSSNTTSSGLNKASKNHSAPSTSPDAPLSLTSDICQDLTTGTNGSSNATKSNCVSSFVYKQDTPNWKSLIAKDEILLKLVSHVEELKSQLHDWTEWAQEKVMQAARRLNKEKVELQILRREKDEAARLLKERETLEVSMMKKVAETEYAWSKACAQYEMSNATMERLKDENNKLGRQLVVSKEHAAKLATNCQDATMREIMTLKKIQSWEREKQTLAEELAAEKHKFLHLNRELEEAKERHGQSEDRWKIEDKAKQDALLLVAAERKESEQIEASSKLEEAALALKAESDLQRHKDEIRRLQEQISKMRMDSHTKVPVLSWNMNAHSNIEIFDSQVSENEVQRDKECVMCLTEEMSVVFLPCAHQVVCEKCNELHEKQGLKDCPSCRTPIHRRIHVRSI
ncbi:putative E3 ubiquitin-protein ligase RF298 [Curcuma longa]|uniref:putative E3 ubiquitin-protein ligase RF298 n=1 Tax=Curcuma longa TaxID=136217 RepID=UPI003D9F606C